MDQDHDNTVVGKSFNTVVFLLLVGISQGATKFVLADCEYWDNIPHVLIGTCNQKLLLNFCSIFLNFTKSCKILDTD